jgi:hypothetical protein
MKNLFSRYFSDEITKFVQEELSENRFYRALNKMNQYFKRDELLQYKSMIKESQ